MIVRLLAVVVAIALLLTMAVRYLNFLEDDALISATYAQRLLEGKGLTWTDGTHVEGYSNLLWVLALALVGLVEPDLVNALRILAATCFLSATVLLGFWGGARRPFFGAASVAALAFASSGPVAVWTFGGLEQPLLALLLIAASGLFLAVLEDPVCKPGDLVAPGAVFGLVCLVRPDGPLWCVPAGIAVLMVAGRKGLRLRRLVALSTGPLVALVSVEIFRLVYYNSWVPNTALVKLSPSGEHFGDGLRYVIGGWGSIAPAAVLAGVAVAVSVLRARFLRTAVYLALGPALWSVYLVFIGGGIFSGYRHFVPVVAILAVAIAHEGDVALSALERSRTRVIVGIGIAILIVLNLSAQLVNPEFRRARETSWVWAGRDIADLLVDAYGRQPPTLAVTAAGSIPFWTRFPCIDMLGLNDPYIARSRPEDLGHGFIGHEHGDGAYILGRKPDIIQPCGPWGGIEPCYRAAKELHSDGSLQRLYAPVTFRRPPVPGTAHVHTTIWLRRDSPLVGVRQIGETLVVPATLARPKGAISGVALVSGPGQIGVPMGAGQSYVARLPFQPQGRWSAHLEPPTAADITLETGVDPDGSEYPAVTVVPRTSVLVRRIILTPKPSSPRPAIEGS